MSDAITATATTGVSGSEQQPSNEEDQSEHDESIGHPVEQLRVVCAGQPFPRAADSAPVQVLFAASDDPDKQWPGS